MELTQKKMAASAKEIGKKKFSAMSTKRQHELLAALAWDGLSNNNYAGFLRRYQTLQSWAELDTFSPPSWLSETEALHEYISFHNTFTPSPVFPQREIPDREPEDAISWTPRFQVEVILDQVKSPFNVGSVLRLIDNFGFSGLVHSTPTLSLNHPQLVKSGRGSHKWIPVRYEKDLLAYLKASTDPVIGIETGENMISVKDWEPPAKCKIVLGNETYGIAQAIRSACHQIVEIPMFGFKNSMNVTHAFSIVAAQIAMRHGAV